MGNAAAVQIWLRRPSPAISYAVALLLSTTALVVRLPLHPQTQIPFITFVPFLVLAGAIGGLGPGLLGTFLCALESLYFATEPLFSLRASDPQSWLGVGALALTGVITSLVFEELKKEGEQLRGAYVQLASAHAASKRGQEELQDAHRRTKAILDSISDGFNVFDREWRYVYVNPAAAD